MHELLIPVIAFWFANITGIPQKIRNGLGKQRLKPLDCAKCLAFWLALIQQLIEGFNYNSLYVLPLCSMAAYLIERAFVYLKIPYNV